MTDENVSYHELCRQGAVARRVAGYSCHSAISISRYASVLPHANVTWNHAGMCITEIGIHVAALVAVSTIDIFKAPD